MKEKEEKWHRLEQKAQSNPTVRKTIADFFLTVVFNY